MLKLVPKKKIVGYRAKNDDINSKKCFASKQRKPHQVSKFTLLETGKKRMKCFIVLKKTNEMVKLTNKIVNILKRLKAGDQNT